MRICCVFAFRFKTLTKRLAALAGSLGTRRVTRAPISPVRCLICIEAYFTEQGTLG